MSPALVVREDRGPVAVLTLNRPQQRNALSRALVAELRDAVDAVSIDERIRVVVLVGAGPSFCAGMDLKEAAALDASPQAEHETIATLQEFADLLQRLHTLPKPTIAAVNGDALAGGAGLMAACDVAIAAERARIGYPEVLRGLAPSIVMHDLLRQIGDRRARQLLLSGDLIMSTQAAQWGLVNTVTPNDRCLDEAIRVAESMAQHCAPLAMATIKKLLDEASSRPRDLRGAAAVSAAIRIADEAREGIRAFVEKRPPSWAWLKPQEEAP
jgi:methylglutaconyl-CoA hydratase